MSPLSMTKWLYGYSKQGNALYKAMYHIVLATKYGYKVLKGGVADYLKVSLEITEKNYPKIRILEASADEDHLCMQVSIPPEIAAGQAVNIIKINTGRALKEKFRFLNGIYGTVARSTFKKEFSNGGLIFDRLIQKGYFEMVSATEVRLKANMDEVRKCLEQEYPYDSVRILTVLRQSHYGGAAIWSMGCLISTTEISEEIIRKYIEYQGDEDRGQFRLEF